MLKKNKPGKTSCFGTRRAVSARCVCRSGWLAALLFLTCCTGSLAQSDSTGVPDSSGTRKTDSTDYYLATDTNTHDVSGPVTGLYVPDRQELRHVPASRIRGYKMEDSFAYANDPAYWQHQPVAKTPDLNLQLYWRIFLFVSGGFLLYGVYRLAKENFSGVFLRQSGKSKKEADPGPGSEELLSPDDLENNIALAVGRRDWAAAVRFHYLKLIRALQDRQMAPAGMLATNRAWSGVFSDPEMATQFRSLAGAYEYVVYGGFAPDEQQFGDIQKRFADFSQKLPG